MSFLEYFWPDPYDTLSKFALLFKKMHKVFKNKDLGCCTPLKLYIIVISWIYNGFYTNVEVVIIWPRFLDSFRLLGDFLCYLKVRAFLLISIGKDKTNLYIQISWDFISTSNHISFPGDIYKAQLEWLNAGLHFRLVAISL